jgi:hypothetical protein
VVELLLAWITCPLRAAPALLLGFISCLNCGHNTAAVPRVETKPAKTSGREASSARRSFEPCCRDGLRLEPRLRKTNQYSPPETGQKRLQPIERWQHAGKMSVAELKDSLLALSPEERHEFVAWVSRLEADYGHVPGEALDQLVAEIWDQDVRKQRVATSASP